MTALNLMLIVAGAMLAVGLVAVSAWLVYSWYLDRVERRLARRKGLYRELVSDLGTSDRALLDPTIHQISTLHDLDVLEAVLKEQARGASGGPGWLLDVYDELGLVDKYIDMLRSARKSRERAFAAELLGRVSGAKAVPALLEVVVATRTEDSYVHEVTLRALTRIADPKAVEPLVEALQTAEPWLAPQIADILSRHGEAAVEPLIGMLKDGDHSPARAWAANILGQVGARRAYAPLVSLLDDPEDEVRGQAVTALSRLADQRAVPHLLEHLFTDPASFVRVRIAASLGEDPAPEVRSVALTALGDLLDPDELLATAIRALDDSNVLVRRAGVALFSKGIPSRALPSLVQALGVDEDPAVLSAAAAVAEEQFDLFTQAALSASDDPERAILVLRVVRHMAHPYLATLPQHFAGSTSADVRLAVTDLWKNRPDISDHVCLAALTNDPEVTIRRSAAAAAVAAERYELLGPMTQDPDASVRREIALALGGAQPMRPPGLAILDFLAADREMAVRAAAYVAHLLQGIGLSLPPELDPRITADTIRHSANVPALRESARTAASDEQRLAAALALALLQDEVAQEVARIDPAPSVRHRVAGALELLIVRDTDSR